MTERIGSLNLYGDDIEVNTDNISLWEHKEEPELDHVYIRLPERYNDGEQARAFYLWKHIGQSAVAFALFRDEIIENSEVEKHLAIRKSDPNDREEFHKTAGGELDNWDELNAR